MPIQRPLTALLLAGLTLCAQGQEALRPEITRLERLPNSQRDNLPEQIAPLRARARDTSDEQFDLIYLLANHYAGQKMRTQLEGLERDFAPWRNAAQADQRLLGELAWALVWTGFHRSSHHYPLAQQEMQSLKPELLGNLPLKWRYRERAVRADVLEETGQIDEALLLRLDAARLAGQMQQRWRQASALASLAYTYLRAGQADKAKEAADEALRLAEQEREDHDLLSSTYNTKAIVHSDDADQTLARQALERALEHARLGGDERMQALLMGNLSDTYLRSGDFTRALAITQEVIPLTERLKDTPSQILAMHNGGIAKIALKRIAEGKADVLKAITMERQQGATTSVSESWQELGTYLERANDFAGAMNAYEEHRRIADTLSRADQRKRVLEAQEQFDAERRGREKQLLGQETALQAEQIKARNLQLLQWGLMMASGLAAMVLLVMIFKRMRKTNEELARSNEELAARSERDPLTGLANRRHFQREVKQHLRDNGLQGTLFLIDIDHFKRLNDNHGHAGGDTVLVAVAQRLRAAVRENDLVVRWGGEEFLVLVSTREPQLTSALALRMLRELGEQPISLGGDQTVRVTASIGFASFPVAGGDAAPEWERAVDIVDALMYQAKAHGRNQAWGLTMARAKTVAELSSLVDELHDARERGELAVHVLAGPGAKEGQA